MRSAQEMYDYCFRNGYTVAQPTKLKKCCIGLANILNANEDVLLCFMGIHNYASAINYDGFYLYAITNQRFVLITSTLFGCKHINFSNYDITYVDYTTGMGLAKLQIDISGVGKLIIAMKEIIAKDIVRKLRELLPIIQSRPMSNGQSVGSNKTSYSAWEARKKRRIWWAIAIVLLLIGGIIAQISGEDRFSRTNDGSCDICGGYATWELDGHEYCSKHAGSKMINDFYD